MSCSWAELSCRYCGQSSLIRWSSSPKRSGSRDGTQEKAPKSGVPEPSQLVSGGAQSVFVWKPLTHYDHSVSSVWRMCVFSVLPVRVVRCEIECLSFSLPKPGFDFNRFLSSAHHHLSPRHKLPPPMLRQWPCYCPRRTPLPSLPIPLPPCILYCLSLPHHSAPCLSSSPFSQGQFCVINSPVALLAHQLCHPYGQIKNWFLRLIPCTGWMRPSSSFALTPWLALHPGELHIDALSLCLQPSPVSPLCAIKSFAVCGHTRTPPNLSQHFIGEFLDSEADFYPLSRRSDFSSLS